jgi:hypothetical protein
MILEAIDIDVAAMKRLVPTLERIIGHITPAPFTLTELKTFGQAQLPREGFYVRVIRFSNPRSPNYDWKPLPRDEGRYAWSWVRANLDKHATRKQTKVIVLQSSALTLTSSDANSRDYHRLRGAKHIRHSFLCLLCQSSRTQRLQRSRAS